MRLFSKDKNELNFLKKNCYNHVITLDEFWKKNKECQMGFSTDTSVCELLNEKGFRECFKIDRNWMYNPYFSRRVQNLVALINDFQYPSHISFHELYSEKDFSLCNYLIFWLLSNNQEDILVYLKLRCNFDSNYDLKTNFDYGPLKI